jgi:hypothetical protein
MWFLKRGGILTKDKLEHLWEFYKTTLYSRTLAKKRKKPSPTV